MLTDFATIYTGTMTIEMPVPEVHSAGVQCNLLAAPPLRKLKNLEESLPSEVEETFHFLFPRKKAQLSKYKWVHTY